MFGVKLTGISITDAGALEAVKESFKAMALQARGKGGGALMAGGMTHSLHAKERGRALSKATALYVTPAV